MTASIHEMAYEVYRVSASAARAMAGSVRRFRARVRRAARPVPGRPNLPAPLRPADQAEILHSAWSLAAQAASTVPTVPTASVCDGRPPRPTVACSYWVRCRHHGASRPTGRRRSTF